MPGREALMWPATNITYLAACSSIIGSLIPRWAQAGTKQDFLDRLRDPETREKIKREVIRNLRRRGGAERLFIGRYPPEPEYAGKSMAQISEMMGLDYAETTLRLVEPFNPQLVTYSMQERRSEGHNASPVCNGRF